MQNSFGALKLESNGASMFSDFEVLQKLVQHLELKAPSDTYPYQTWLVRSQKLKQVIP